MGLFSKSKQKDVAKDQSDWQACEFPFKRDYGMAPRRVPSSAGLPDNWTTEMDEFICYSDAIGDLAVKVIIISLKKRFPELNMFAISEPAIERRLFCLDRMENNYFKKGSVIAVQRLESAGIRLPPEPEYDTDRDENKATKSQKISPAEPVTPAKSSTAQAGAVRMIDQNNAEFKGSPTARYSHERYTNKTIKEPSTTLIQHPVRSESTLRTASRENKDLNPQASIGKSGSSNFRPGNGSGRRPKDVAPAASFSHLRISEDSSQLEGAASHNSRSNDTIASNSFPFGAKGRSNYQPEGLSQASSVNPSLGFSSGSPRLAHGRVKPAALNSNMGSGSRQTDENLPLSASTTVNFPTEAEGSTLSSRRYA
ncbi:MAG: hypothetical protein Q9225_004275 [Loekoesia sp. 1 TL-2023]